MLTPSAPGLLCDDQIVLYEDWCKSTGYCTGVQTKDQGICRNITLWQDRPCNELNGHHRGVCKETPGRCAFEESICDGLTFPWDPNGCGNLDYR